MNKLILNLLILSIVFASFSCKKEEKVINSGNNNWNLLVANNDNSLALFSFPDLVERNPNILAISSVTLNSPVTRIVEFNHLYAMVPEDNKILVIDKTNYSLIAEIDFSANGLMPIDITFANATDAYVIHKDSPVVSLVDITVYEATLDIAISGAATDIEAVGNQVFVAVQLGNRVQVIDTRTKNVEAEIITDPNPTFVSRTSDGSEVMITCLGMGKIDEAVPSPASVQFVEVASRSVTDRLELGTMQVSATEIHPSDALITDKDWAYIVSNRGYFRVDAFNKNRVDLINTLNLSQIIYDFRREELLVAGEIGGQKELYQADEITGTLLEAYKLSEKATFILPF